MLTRECGGNPRSDPRLVRFAFLLVGDQETAEDVVQDAFAAVHRRWRRLADHDDLLPYLRTAVLNGCRAVHRRRAIARWTLIRYDAMGRHLLIMGNMYPLSRWEDGQVTVLVRPEAAGAHSPAPDSPDASPQEMLAAW
ncbi:sigma factor [Microtetraspora glauca]|uniref:Sigma factor n=1 Tax=Microtetraspora glauca TaxID=1996 RepID=A0ABV3GSU0_MICGL